MTEYPGAIYAPRAKENKAGISYDAAKKTIGYAEDITKLDDEVVAVETELGTNPKGAFASVKARLEALVPYTGANANVDLGVHHLTTLGTVQAEHLHSTDDAHIADVLGIGTTPDAKYGIDLEKTFTVHEAGESGIISEVFIDTNAGVAPSTSALNFTIQASAGANNIGLMYGVTGLVSTAGAFGGVVDVAAGLQSAASFAGVGDVTNYYGAFLLAPIGAGAPGANSIGLFVSDREGSSFKYAIRTQGGPVILKGNTRIGGTNDPTVALDVTGAIRASKAISSGSLTWNTVGPTDDLDVSDVNTVFIDAGANAVTIGGFVGGVDGQVLNIIIIDGANAVTLEHAEGGGDQDILLHRGADETLVGEYGGWTLVCHAGVDWHDASHAKHV